MKDSKIVLLFICTLLITAHQMHASTFNTGINDTEIRNELQILEKKALSSADLGNWETIIHSTLFTLLRSTELYRGPLRVLVPEQKEITISLYSDGTFVISSSLLDYIDTFLFDSAAISLRKMQAIDAEREFMLALFIAPEISALALGQNLNAPRSSSQTLEGDRFAPIILSLAGYDPLRYQDWIKNLSSLYTDSSKNEPFINWLQNKPSPSLRLESISNSLANITNLSSEFSLVLASLKTGTGLKETSDLCVNLSEIYPQSLYLYRLSALVNHMLWLETVPSTTLILKPLLPFANEFDLSRAKFTTHLADNSLQAPVPFYMDDQDSIPGNISYFMKASESYKKALNYIEDPVFASGQAQLLMWSGNTAVRKAAMLIAEESASREIGSESFIARANFANILYLTGIDYIRCQYILENLIGEIATTNTKTGVFVSSGFPGDSRDMLLNLILILRSLTDSKKADELLPIFITQTEQKNGNMSFRNLNLGVNQDTLTEIWGKPTEIVYNYFTEYWFYHSLKASVLLTIQNKKNQPTVSLIRITNGSPVSPGNDIRTGDKIEDFTQAHGNFAYKNGDKYVYLIGDNRLSVWNLYGTIRTITVGL